MYTKRTLIYEVFTTIDTNETHTLTPAPDLIITFDPTNVLISVAAIIKLHIID